MSSAYPPGSFAQNEPLNLEGMEESLPTAQASSPSPSEVEQSPSESARLDALERQARMTNKLMGGMQETLTTLLRRSKSRSQSQRSASPPKSPD